MPNRPYPKNKWGAGRNHGDVSVYQQMIKINMAEIEVLQYNIQRHVDRIRMLNEECFKYNDEYAMDTEEPAKKKTKIVDGYIVRS